MKKKCVYAGDIPGYGIYECTCCGSRLNLNDDVELPVCPRCTNTSYNVDRSE